MNEEKITKSCGFLFRWKYKSAANPSSRFAARVRHLTLLCNECDAPVISGAPYNYTGQRYFTYYATQAAIEHAAGHGLIDAAKGR